ATGQNHCRERSIQIAVSGQFKVAANRIPKKSDLLTPRFFLASMREALMTTNPCVALLRCVTHMKVLLIEHSTLVVG
ncbi:hypothetical protein CVS30_00005, partial [Arthrobacter psychrolactophilus]